MKRCPMCKSFTVEELETIPAQYRCTTCNYRPSEITMRTQPDDPREKIRGTIIKVSRWAGNQIGGGKYVCYEPHPNDEVTVWRNFKSCTDPDCFLRCYRFQVEEPEGLTMSENMRRLTHFVER